MTYQKDRDEFLHIIQQEGLPYNVAMKILRYSQTLHRLAEAQCNGDWPYNGDRDRPSMSHVNVSQGLTGQDLRERWDKRYTICPNCETSGVSKSAMKISEAMKGSGSRSCSEKICPDCRTTELINAALPEGFKAVMQGDPRGCVLKIQVPSGRTNDWSREGICVPVRDK